MTGEPPALVLAPLAGDAATLQRLVVEAGATAARAADATAFAAALDPAAPERPLFVVVTEEGADEACARALEGFAAGEPAWSRLPIVLLVNDADAPPPAARRLEAGDDPAHLVVLERPVRPGVLRRVLARQAESRRRQYATRDLLARLDDAERRQRFLLNEVRHRTRNMLAVLQALFSLTAHSQRDLASFVEVFGRRLDTLSRAHTRLTGEGGEATTLAELVAEHVTPYAAAEAQVRATGPPVRLGPRTAFNLAIVFHELATNAVKYGALSSPGGEVAVDWGCPEANEDAALDLIWRERGGPGVAAPAAEGLGLDLVRRLGGEEAVAAELAFPPEGVVWRCRLPARTFAH